MIFFSYCVKMGGNGRILKARLVDFNDDYIGIRTGITTNTRCCNVILITIHLFVTIQYYNPRDNGRRVGPIHFWLEWWKIRRIENGKEIKKGGRVEKI